MFKIFTTARRNKELEQECESLKKQVAILEYQLKDAKEVDKFHAESERRAWKSKRFHEARAAKLKEEGEELKNGLEADNNELKSRLREQGDADLILIALQGVGLILSKGAVDKFVSDGALAKESIRKRMNKKGVSSSLDDQNRRDCDNAYSSQFASMNAIAHYGEGRGAIHTATHMNC